MTSNEIAHNIIEGLHASQYPIFLTSFAGAAFNEADVFAINRNGYMYEFEIKRSRSDFLADFRNKKHKHQLLSSRTSTHVYDVWKHGKKTDEKKEYILIPNRFFFACEPNLLIADDIPEYAGLIYVEPNGTFSEKKKAPLLHRNKANSIIYERISTILSQRTIYGCSYYRYRQESKTSET